MQSLLDNYFNPEHYHPEAVAKAKSGQIAELDRNLLIIRLMFAFQAGHMVEAEQIVQPMLKDSKGGYELFQLTTAAMIVAFLKDDKPAFIFALNQWLEGRRNWQGNWNSDVLQTKSFASWLTEVDPAMLVEPPPVKTELSESDRAFAKNGQQLLQKAIEDNLSYFKDMDIHLAADELVKLYRLSYVDQHLREITFDADNDFPSLTVALDTEEKYLGSFMSH